MLGSFINSAMHTLIKESMEVFISCMSLTMHAFYRINESEEAPVKKAKYVFMSCLTLRVYTFVGSSHRQHKLLTVLLFM